MTDLLEIAARVAHEANRAYCIGLGDTSQPDWDSAPDWQKDSALKGVSAISRNPRTTPEMSHLLWMAVKINDGWRWGAEKNPEAREHPCLVRYRDLPAEQQTKDRIFVETVKAVLGL